jgi:hypothetical protein
MRRMWTGIVVILLGAPAVAAQEPSFESRTPNTIHLKAGTPRPTAGLDTVSWLAGGTWRGDGLGGATDETWSTPAAGAMIGMFRALRKDESGREVIQFYEFLTFAETDGSLALRVKHFNADFTGWEEKAAYLTFRLARVTPEAVYFDGLTFRREGPDRMTIFLALRSGGDLREEVFRMTRTGR